MAITKIHAIKRTIDKSINYICNPDKTNGKSLTTFFNCSEFTAAFDFQFALKQAQSAPRENANLAYHLIQSFAPGEVSDEEAHAIGEELAKAILGNKYSYVLATHNDRNHCHNHIIFCAADNVDHKKYHDCKETYKVIQKENDRICAAHNLSVIRDKSGLRNSHSRTEWENKKRGTSWKAILRKDINSCLEFCPDYETFLKRMRKLGYEIKNEYPEEGTYIAFRSPNFVRWIRGRATTLGPQYTRDAIIEFIENYPDTKESKSDRKIRKNIDNLTADEILERINTSSEKFSENEYLKKWADKENFKISAHNYALMHRLGIHSTDELSDNISILTAASQEQKSKAASIDRKLDSLANVIRATEQYLNHKSTFNEYVSAPDKEEFFQKHEMELTLYDGARAILKREGIALKTISEDSLEEKKEEYVSYEKEKQNHLSEAAKFIDVVSELKKLQDNLALEQSHSSIEYQIQNKTAKQPGRKEGQENHSIN